MLKLALLDIGSNSIHMVLTEIQPDFSYKILDRCKDVPRLGEETFQTGQLSPDAIAKGIEVVRTFTTLARNRGFTRVEAVATSAVREAANGGDLIEAIERVVGNRTKLLHAASLKLGAIRLNDLYLKKETSSDALKRLEKAVAAQLKPALPRFKKIGF